MLTAHTDSSDVLNTLSLPKSAYFLPHLQLYFSRHHPFRNPLGAHASRWVLPFCEAMGAAGWTPVLIQFPGQPTFYSYSIQLQGIVAQSLGAPKRPWTKTLKTALSRSRGEMRPGWKLTWGTGSDVSAGVYEQVHVWYCPATRFPQQRSPVLATP